MVAGMQARRRNRDEFYDMLAGLDAAGLKKTLWTLYWRGSGPLQQRIEAGRPERPIW
jgi:hypothetical protein